jgi:hypothetical protein
VVAQLLGRSWGGCVWCSLTAEVDYLLWVFQGNGSRIKL